MRTRRLRNEIANFLIDREANTREIHDHLNSRFKYGATMNQVGNILSKDSRFKKTGTCQASGAISGNYTLLIWALNN
jgi:hypothetical protein